MMMALVAMVHIFVICSLKDLHFYDYHTCNHPYLVETAPILNPLSLCPILGVDVLILEISTKSI